MDDGMARTQKAVKRNGHALGLAGERLAAQKLTSQGYRIRERNFRCHFGEIDLVAEDEHDLIFVEVKTRRGTRYGLPEEAVNVRKRRKLLQAAKYYIASHCRTECSWRVDIVAIQLSDAGKLEEIRIYQHALTE